MRITIVVEELARNYEVEADIEVDWTWIVGDMIDSIQKTRGDYEMPLFSGTRDALDKLKI
jgi:hypothetical protein